MEKVTIEKYKVGDLEFDTKDKAKAFEIFNLVSKSSNDKPFNQVAECWKEVIDLLAEQEGKVAVLHDIEEPKPYWADEEDKGDDYTARLKTYVCVEEFSNSEGRRFYLGQKYRIGVIDGAFKFVMGDGELGDMLINRISVDRFFKESLGLGLL